MTDVHCHVSGGDPAIREFLIGRDFVGVHPWEARSVVEGRWSEVEAWLRRQLEADPKLGVGEIGLDRLKERDISPAMRELFERQLKLAVEFHRPVVLHGAKCWGQVVQAVRRLANEKSIHHCPPPPFFSTSFLFHGFSRSDGLVPDIVALNGYISVGPTVLNEHAVNYREFVKKIPRERLVLETDRTEETAATCPSVRAVAEKVAELRGISREELEAVTDANAFRMMGASLKKRGCSG